MKQYNAIKVKYPDALLLFRVGDFYETFGSDAVKAANILDIILTKRGAGSESETELAGFPHHSLNTYLPKLVKAGERVAICDQLEDPKLTKSIVKRGVTELVTPGVALNDEVLSSKSNNFLAAVYFGKTIGVAFLDVSTGEFLTAQGSAEYIGKLLQNFNPSEVLIEKQKRALFNTTFGADFHTFYLEDWVFQDDYANDTLCKHFQTKTLKGFGIEALAQGIVASGAVMHYLAETQHHKLQHITAIERILEGDYVWMDKFTIRNLELYHSTNTNAVTLIDVIDHTISPMGGRLLKRWLALPLKSQEKIKARHEVVQYFLDHEEALQRIQNYIKQVGDLERLISKVATGKVNPREVVQLKNSLEAIVPIKALASNCDNADLKRIGEQIQGCELLREKIKATLNEDAPVNILKGNSIASAASEELESLRAIAFSGKDYLNKMLERESAATGITSLKIASNNVFGYYIEVRNSRIKTRCQKTGFESKPWSMLNGISRKSSKNMKAKILGAEDRILVIEQTLFSELVSWMHSYILEVQQNAQLIAQLDCLGSFAHLAQHNNYVYPELDASFDLDIKQGRHPVIEKQLPLGESYVANDVFLDQKHPANHYDYRPQYVWKVSHFTPNGFDCPLGSNWKFCAC